MTATTDVPDLVESWAAAEQGSDVEALDRLLAGDFVGVGLVGFVLGRDQWLARFGNGLENRGTAASRRAHPTRAAETERHPEDENEVRGTMEGFDPFDSFGLEVASSYDEDLRGDEAETVEFLAEHAGTGPVLEFAIGTGRIALPLSERGIRVDGIEQSTAMVDQLRAKPGADKISITIGDMSAVELPEQYTLVYLVFNTIHNLLTQDGQVRCFENAARHLDSDGVFVVETGAVAWSARGQLYRGAQGDDGRGPHQPAHLRRDDADPRHQSSAAHHRGHPDVPALTAACLPERARPDGADRRAAAPASLGRLEAGDLYRAQPSPCERVRAAIDNPRPDRHRLRRRMAAPVERRRLTMSKVVLDVSMSLDGFTAGPNVRDDEPMGDGGERLHEWHAG
ncbi:MAG: methyltransferase domain-containing protein [Actinomycetota bacterium]